MKKAITIILLLIVAVMLVAACGGKKEEESAPASQPAAEQAEEATPLPAGDPAKGAELFSQTCQACHGEGGVGIEGLGKDMVHSEFIAGLSDAELLAFIKRGRPSGDPQNTTGIDMPPKGGNPALTDEQLLDIIAYIRTLQQQQ